MRAKHLWEVLLVERLHLPWAQAHDYACRLEHATDTAVTEALAAYLNHPTACPHGNRIPTGQNVCLVWNQVQEKLARRLTALNMAPGVEVAILQDAGSTLVLAVRGPRIALGRPIAHDLLVECS